MATWFDPNCSTLTPPCVKKNNNMVKVKQKQQYRGVRRQNDSLIEKSGSVKWIYLWGALVAVISILVAAIWGITFFSSSTTVNSDSLGRSHRAAVYKRDRIKQRILPSPHASFAEDCARDGIPVVLRNSISKTWKASKKWSPAYLKSKLPKISGVYENNNRWFGPYFDRSKPLLKNAVRQNPYKTGINMSASEFFDILLHPRENKYHYFTGSIDDLGEWAYSEIQPLGELLLLNPKLSSVNVWIGQPHVIAHCHYDGYHNFYAQLYGRKKFTLFSPSNWPGLYPYPFLHPSHAQAQVNASNVGSVENFELVHNVEALEVILEPGDLLYMPPLWFHEVESQSVSISVNVWTDSRQTELMVKMFSVPLPFESDEPTHRHRHAKWRSAWELRVAAALLVHKILDKVCSYRRCVDSKSDKFFDPASGMSHHVGFNQSAYFVFQLWSTRYRTLMENAELPRELPNGSAVLCESGSKEMKGLVHKVDSDILEDVHYGAYVEQIGQLVRGLPEQTWPLWIGNFVESVAYRVVEDAQYVGLYLMHWNSCIKLLR